MIAEPRGILRCFDFSEREKCSGVNAVAGRLLHVGLSTGLPEPDLSPFTAERPPLHHIL